MCLEGLVLGNHSKASCPLALGFPTRGRGTHSAPPGPRWSAVARRLMPRAPPGRCRPHHRRHGPPVTSGCCWPWTSFRWRSLLWRLRCTENVLQKCFTSQKISHVNSHYCFIQLTWETEIMIKWCKVFPRLYQEQNKTSSRFYAWIKKAQLNGEILQDAFVYSSKRLPWACTYKECIVMLIELAQMHVVWMFGVGGRCLNGCQTAVLLSANPGDGNTATRAGRIILESAGITDLTWRYLHLPAVKIPGPEEPLNHGLARRLAPFRVDQQHMSLHTLSG